MDRAAMRLAAACEARRWIGTPYVHQASLRGVGCDCLGLLRGVWRAAVGPEPETPPAYAPDWGEAPGEEPLLAGALRWLRPAAAAAPGCALLFRMREGGPAKHLGVMSAPGLMVHAWSGRVAAEVPLDRAWRRRLVGAFDCRLSFNPEG